MSKLKNYFVKNFARIELFNIEFDPERRIYEVTGKNSQGKTSATMALWMLLQSRTANKIVKRPVKNGAGEANVIVETDTGLRIEKVIREEDSKEVLRVTDTNSGMTSDKQSIVDKLLGKTLDIKAFTELDASGQVKALLNILGLQEKLEAIESKYKELYDSRTVISREHTRLKAIVEKEPSKEIKVETADLVKEHQNLLTGQSTYKAYVGTIASYQSQIAAAENQVKYLTDQIKSFKEQVDKAQKAMVEVDEARLKEVSELLANSAEINKKADAYADWLDTKETFDEFTKKYNEHTDKLQKLSEEKESLLTSAKFPLEGISFVDNQVMFNGTPLVQLKGSAEESLVCFALAAVSIPENGLRVIRVPNGEGIDDVNKAKMEALAEKYDVQVLFECMDDDEKRGIYIEDGKIKRNNYKK